MKKSTFLSRLRRHIRAHTKKDVLILVASAFFLFLSVVIFWISTLRLPDLSSFDSRKVTESTKIYDRTGQILLYDLHDDVKRTVVASSDISPFIKDASVAIEDEGFYHEGGIKISSIIRAFIADIFSGQYSQGGSTITQQVVKNTLLTGDKSITRKLKEWILAIKLDHALSKDEILTNYLNENPYGGSIYGVEEASREFFNKDAKDVDLAEAAYLAAIPQASTYYSPYGPNTQALNDRKNLVLEKMLENKFITQDQYTQAKAENVQFQPQDQHGIIAPHFVFYVKQWLENILGTGALDGTGYKVITTLDADMQAKAEDLVKITALSNTTNFNASNAALVAIDPTNGQILSLVGSRDYFDTTIDGQFDVATDGKRQPGSTMKPIIYSEAFIKGYTPDTMLFDLKTEFSTACNASSTPFDPNASSTVCYSPQNYDGIFRGPISMRDALAQSINVPSVKVMYLAGVSDSLNLAKQMGLTSLTNAAQYGLTLVLGGGEVSLLDMTSAYTTFANDGVHVPYTPVLHLYDSSGNEVALPQQQPNRILQPNIAETISNILSDNVARTPAYGPNSVLYFPNQDVAVKTGTTNDSRDAWTVGYTPNLVVGVWAGNNDNSPMVKKVAGQIVAPMWSAFMHQVLPSRPVQSFIPYTPADPTTLKPVMKGIWQGGQTYTIDTVSGKLATQYTPDSTKKEVPVQSVHDILYWVDKDNPLGPAPVDPSADPEFTNWETPVRAWAAAHGYVDQSPSSIPTATDDVHTAANSFSATISNFNQTTPYNLGDSISIDVNSGGNYQISQASLYVNGSFVQTLTSQPFIFRFTPKDIPNIKANNVIRVSVQDTVFDKRDVTGTLNVNIDQ